MAASMSSESDATKGLLVGHVLRLAALDGVARFLGRALYKALRVGNDVSTRLEQRFENCHRHILVVFGICCATNQNCGLKICGGIGLSAIVQDLDQTFIGKLRLLSATHHRSIHTARSKRRQAVGKRGIDWARCHQRRALPQPAHAPGTSAAWHRACRQPLPFRSLRLLMPELLETTRRQPEPKSVTASSVVSMPFDLPRMPAKPA